MPGLLSNLFESDLSALDQPLSGDQASSSEGSSSDNGSGEEESGSSSQSQSSQYDAEAGGGLDLSHSVGVSHSAEASWEGPDGTTHSYSNDTDVVFTADASAALGAAGSLGQSSFDES